MRGDARDAARRPVSGHRHRARARSSPRIGRWDARARGGGPNFATARLPRRCSRATTTLALSSRRRAATVVPRFRKRARSRSRGAVPSQRAAQIDANVANETFARPEPRVSP